MDLETYFNMVLKDAVSILDTPRCRCLIYIYGGGRNIKLGGQKF